jgi:hypothetical protein
MDIASLNFHRAEISPSGPKPESDKGKRNTLPTPHNLQMDPHPDLYQISLCPVGWKIAVSLIFVDPA